MIVRSTSASLDINVDHSGLLRSQIVDVELRSEPQLPIHWFEAGAAVKQIDAQAEILPDGPLHAIAEEIKTARVG